MSGVGGKAEKRPVVWEIGSRGRWEEGGEESGL